MNLRPERGVTLTELTIVMVLAALITVGLVTFYLNSQGMWLDASSQALTQRDATLVLETMSRQIRASSSAQVADDPDSLHQTLFLFDQARDEFARFWWSASDSLVHRGQGASGEDQGPIAMSKAERFQVDCDGKIVQLRVLSMRSTTGQPVELTSSVAMYNK